MSLREKIDNDYKNALKSKLEFISSNIYEKKSEKLAFKPYVIIEKNNFKIGVVGLSDNSKIISSNNSNTFTIVCCP